MKTLIEVKIFGETFTVTSEDEEKHVQELANFVDQRMNRYGKRTETHPPTPLRSRDHGRSKYCRRVS